MSVILNLYFDLYFGYTSTSQASGAVIYQSTYL